MMASSSQIDQMIENDQSDTREFAQALMHKYSGYIQRLATSTQVPANFSASETQATNAIPTAISSPNAVISTQIVPTPTLEQASSTQRTEVITYTVKAGDTIFDIANKFNLKPETILWGNLEAFAEDPHILPPGMVLNILPLDGVYYQWQEGDTLAEVAAQTGVQPEDILNWPGNRLEPQSYQEGSHPDLQPGDTLVIPGGHAALIAPGFAEFKPPQWTSLDIRPETPYNGEELGIGFCEQSVSGAMGTGTFAWPISSPQIKGYDNYGVYLVGAEGDPVYASDSGVVVFVGWSNAHHGNLIIIDHGNGWQTSYGNLNATQVGCGESVSQGGWIGTIGSTGSDLSSKSRPGIKSGPTLQFEIVKDYTSAVNPLLYFAPRSTAENPIATPSSPLISGFVRQTDGLCGYSMLRPENWEVSGSGCRFYAPPTLQEQRDRLALRVLNYQVLSQRSFGGMIAQFALFEADSSLDGWTRGIEGMWQSNGVDFTLVDTLSHAKIYVVSSPGLSDLQVIAYVVDQDQPLGVELLASGAYADLERLRKDGLFDDFVTMVGSLQAIPYDPANVTPALPDS